MVRVMVMVMVRVRVPVRVKGTITVQVRASNKAVCELYGSRGVPRRKINFKIKLILKSN